MILRCKRLISVRLYLVLRPRKKIWIKRNNYKHFEAALKSKRTSLLIKSMLKVRNVFAYHLLSLLYAFERQEGKDKSSFVIKEERHRETSSHQNWISASQSDHVHRRLTPLMQSPRTGRPSRSGRRKLGMGRPESVISQHVFPRKAKTFLKLAEVLFNCKSSVFHVDPCSRHVEMTFPFQTSSAKYHAR